MAFLDWLGSWFPSSAGRAAGWGGAALEQAPTPAPQPRRFGGVARKARDYLARIGQGDSKALLDWESWIGQQAVAMRAQALQDMQRLGVTALTGAAGSPTGAAGPG